VVTIVPAHAPAGGQRTISLPVTRSGFESWDVGSDFVVGFLLPFVSLLLGFWVAFRRPRDPLAWLLLALMLSFPHILQTTVVYGWPPGSREAGVLYESTLEAAFPIIIFLFGRFFPEPFPQGSNHDKVWRALQWLCALPFAILSGLGVIVNVGGLGDYRSVAGLHRMIAPLSPIGQVLAFALIGSFFAAMAIKLGLSQSPDAKRRLRLLYWGATAAFTPSIVVILYARLQGKSRTRFFLPG
jgi:sigma-B regulation protein RsbU (phosphoserine phosphatase)